MIVAIDERLQRALFTLRPPQAFSNAHATATSPAHVGLRPHRDAVRTHNQPSRPYGASAAARRTRRSHQQESVRARRRHSRRDARASRQPERRHGQGRWVRRIACVALVVVSLIVVAFVVVSLIVVSLLIVSLVVVVLSLLAFTFVIVLEKLFVVTLIRPWLCLLLAVHLLRPSKLQADDTLSLAVAWRTLALALHLALPRGGGGSRLLLAAAALALPLLLQLWVEQRLLRRHIHGATDRRRPVGDG